MLRAVNIIYEPAFSGVIWTFMAEHDKQPDAKKSGSPVQPIKGTFSPDGEAFEVNGKRVYVVYREDLKDPSHPFLIDLKSSFYIAEIKELDHAPTAYIRLRDKDTRLGVKLSEKDEGDLYEHFLNKINEYDEVARARHKIVPLYSKPKLPDGVDTREKPNKKFALQ